MQSQHPQQHPDTQPKTLEKGATGRHKYYHIILEDQKNWKANHAIFKSLLTRYLAEFKGESDSVFQKPPAYELCKLLFSEIDAESKSTAANKLPLLNVILRINEYLQKEDIGKDTEFLQLLSAFIYAYPSYKIVLDDKLCSQLDMSHMENKALNYSLPLTLLEQELKLLIENTANPANFKQGNSFLKICGKSFKILCDGCHFLTEEKKEQALNAMMKVINAPELQGYGKISIAESLGLLIKSLSAAKKEKWINDLLKQFDASINIIRSKDFNTLHFYYITLAENFVDLNNEQKTKFLFFLNAQAGYPRLDEEEWIAIFFKRFDKIFPYLETQECNQVLDHAIKLHSDLKEGNDEKYSHGLKLSQCFEHLATMLDPDNKITKMMVTKMDDFKLQESKLVYKHDDPRSYVNYCYPAFGLVFARLDNDQQNIFIKDALKSLHEIEKLDKFMRWPWVMTKLSNVIKGLSYCFKDLTEEQRNDFLETLLTILDNNAGYVNILQLAILQNGLASVPEKYENFFNRIFNVFKQHNDTLVELESNALRRYFSHPLLTLSGCLSSLSPEHQKQLEETYYDMMVFLFDTQHTDDFIPFVGAVFAEIIPQLKTWGKKSTILAEYIDLIRYQVPGIQDLHQLLVDGFPQIVNKLSYEERSTLFSKLIEALMNIPQDSADMYEDPYQYKESFLKMLDTIVAANEEDAQELTAAYLSAKLTNKNLANLVVKYLK